MQWFDYACGAWQWDLERIQATGFTDNVVEFMAQDLRNLPANVRGSSLWALRGPLVSHASWYVVNVPGGGH